MPTLKQFIKDNRHEIDKLIIQKLGDPLHYRYRNDEERRQWVLNEEGIYNWARSEGVEI